MMCLSQGIQAGILGCQNWLHLQYVTVKWKIKRELQLFNLVPVQEMGSGGEDRAAVGPGQTRVPVHAAGARAGHRGCSIEGLLVLPSRR